MAGRLEQLEPGQQIVFGGDRVTTVPPELAQAFRAGDRLVVVQETGDLLHVPAADHLAARTAVDAAVAAFGQLGSDEQISDFFEQFAARLADDDVAGEVLSANAVDIAKAAAGGRSTTRLVMSPTMRDDMIRGLRGWRESPLRRDEPVGRVEHDGWSVEARRAPLGVVGFVFEGRPNVFADATGVLRTGNTVAMRIGSDALGTAEAIVTNALEPALGAAGLPAGSVSLVRASARAAGWALFDDRRLALAVARGSGPAVAQLGAVARQAGTPVSLHGTGGAWLVAGLHADAERFRLAVLHSLDRKVCNTLNVCCIPEARADLVPIFEHALDEAARRRDTSPLLHRVEASGELATEWEWEHSPEVSLVVTGDVAEAVTLCNRYSPRFIASLVSDDEAEHDWFYGAVDAPFVGDGYTRWVDGQYALDTPELGLSNWQGGRLLGRGGVLSGASVHTVRYRARIADPSLHR